MEVVALNVNLYSEPVPVYMFDIVYDNGERNDEQDV